MIRRLFSLLACAWLAWMPSALAHGTHGFLQITPSLFHKAAPLEQALQSGKGHASTRIEGAGRALVLEYASSSPLEVYMLLLNARSSYVPSDVLYFTLPAGENIATIDLTVSPSWSPKERTHLLHMFAKQEGAEAGFVSLDVLPTTIGAIARAPWKHLLAAEPYQPSSYHALRGYRMLGIPFTILWGTLSVIVVVALLLFVPAKKKWPSVLFVLALSPLLYSARIAVDELRFTRDHLRSWFSDGTYDEMGSVMSIAKYAKATMNLSTTKLYVCRDGTNYKEKLLRYHAYPLQLSGEQSMVNDATHVLVMNKIKWTFATSKSDAATGTLHCGERNADVQLLKSFADGAQLFAVKK